MTIHKTASASRAPLQIGTFKHGSEKRKNTPAAEHH